jgi:hypothetical protein
MGRRGTSVVFATVLALSIAAILGRLVIGIVGLARTPDSGFTGADIVLFTVIAFVILVAGIFGFSRRSRLRGLAKLRHAMPYTLVLPVSITSDQWELLRQVGVTTSALHPPQSGWIAPSSSGIRYWTGRNVTGAVRISAPVTYSVGSGLGRFSNSRALVAEVHTGGGAVRIPIFPISERSWFPRLPSVNELESIARELNA